MAPDTHARHSRSRTDRGAGGTRRRPASQAVYRRRRAALVLLVSAVWMLITATHSPAAVTGGTAGHVLAAATLPQVISNVRAWIVGILAAVATMFLTIGGLRYVLAGGDPAEVERAKGSLKSAAVGYGLAVLAPALVSVLQGIVGAS